MYGQIGRKVLRKATSKGANIIKQAANEKAPDQTGLLQYSIVRRIVCDSLPNQATVQVGTSKEAVYAEIVEFGSSRTAAKSILRPTVDENAERVIRTIGDATCDAIVRIAKAAPNGPGRSFLTFCLTV